MMQPTTSLPSAIDSSLCANAQPVVFDEAWHGAGAGKQAPSLPPRLLSAEATRPRRTISCFGNLRNLFSRDRPPPAIEFRPSVSSGASTHDVLFEKSMPSPPTPPLSPGGPAPGATELSLAQAADSKWEKMCDAWANVSAPDGRRRHIITLMRAWVKQGKPDALLDLSSKNLTSFPPLPPNVVKVNLANNRLKDLPEMLARSFPELEHLQVSQNKLRHLPDMPSKLQTLDASDNELKDIDAYLPASLTRVGLDENKFQKIPEALRLLPRETAVELLNNPLEPEVVKETRRQMNEPSYQGPAFVLPRRGTTQRSLSPTQ